ncbi:non-ribosomal peptide synthase/polyketide synthase [Aliikangiella sp. IMCC44359]|uniref:non-ribosomal peptide synthase/polyketide synthase n=1 Tax=Aliikangiella sp. IMCC44359 TaxID=3459125 RepID=UPI00403B1B16
MKINHFPLTLIQQDIYFDQLQSPTSPMYNIGGYIQLGYVNVDKMLIAHQQLIESDDAFGIRITQSEGQVLQYITSERNACLELVDFSDNEEAVIKATEWLNTLFETVIEVENAELFRAYLIKIKEEEYWYVGFAHHICIDGWGFANWARKLGHYYNEQQPTNKTTDEWKNVSLSDQNYLQSNKYQADGDYWVEQYASIPEKTLSHRYLSNNELEKSTPSFRKSFVVDPKDFYDIKILAKNYGIGVNQVLLAIFYAYFRWFNQKEQVAFGVPTYNRRGKLQKEMIGVFTSINPLLMSFSQEACFKDIFISLLKQQKKSYRHQKYPISHLKKKLGITDSIYDVSFSYLKLDSDMVVEGHAAGLNYLSHNHEATPLLITAWEYGKTDTCEIKVDCNRQYFNLHDAEHLADRIQHIIGSITQWVDIPLCKIDFIPTNEKELISCWQNNSVKLVTTDKNSHFNRCIHELFEKQVELNPQQTAVTFNQTLLSYEALNQQANQLARYLRRLGVTTDSHVAICIDRSLEMLISILAVLKSGAAYIPVDPNYPEARISFMLTDSNTEFMISQSDIVERLNLTVNNTVLINQIDYSQFDDGNIEKDSIQLSADNLAYLIYTSGTTGEPKASMTRHAGLCNMAVEQQKHFDVTSDSRVLQFASVAFDAASFDWIMALCNGARLCLISKQEVQSAEKLNQFVKNEKITHATLPPVLLPVLDISFWKSATTLVVAGEACSLSIAQKWAEGRKFFNAYGPSEASIWTTVAEYSHKVDRLPIGKPIANTFLYVVNQNMEQVAIGCDGELLIGGVGLAKGYLNRAELTAEKFIVDPFNTQVKQYLYRTGDLVRWLADGNLEFVGRIDDQVKLRGFRIELSEVESSLLSHHDVDDAIAIVTPEPRRLIAYVVSKRSSELVNELTEQLRNNLPDYMVPSAIIVLDAMPLTVNGKVDKKALPTPSSEVFEETTYYQAPSSEQEKILCDIWEEVLSLEKVGINDNFFRIGGDSILAMQVVSKAAKSGIFITAKQIFELNTIRLLALNAKSKTAVNAYQGEVSGQQLLLPIQHQFLFDNNSNKNHFHQSVLLNAPDDIANNHLEKLVTALYQRHDVLRLKTQFDGKTWLSHYQSLTPKMVADSLNIFDSRGLNQKEKAKQLSEVGSQLKSSISLSDGPVFSMAYFSGEAGCSKLLLILHHFVVDGISWRVLLKDIEHAYAQILNKKEVVLDAKTSSFKQWANYLTDKAKAEETLSQETFWLSQLPANIPALSQQAKKNNCVGNVAKISFSLSKKITEKLLKKSHATYNTQINDLLISALSLGLQEWSGNNRFRIDIESHGRDNINETLDISETLGWFTNIYPLSLNMPESKALKETIISVKESLHSIPENGLSFGLLLRMAKSTQLSQALEQSQAPVLFNYLGQFDQVINKDSRFKLSDEFTGENISQERNRHYDLEFNGMVTDGKLKFELDYNKKQYTQSIIKDLINAISSSLKQIIEHCDNSERVFTPSDFPTISCNQTELDLWQKSYPKLKNVYASTAMQQGMLFHSDIDKGAYTTQISMELPKTLNTIFFKQAWQQVVNRHDVFRTAFVGKRLVQLVVSDVEIAWSEKDWSTQKTSYHSQFNDFLAADSKEGFKIEEPSLLRLYLIRKPEKNWHFIFSCHHALIDGWSVAAVFSEVLNIYEVLENKQKVELANPAQYQDYVAWLQRQGRQSAEDFWKQYLASMKGKTQLDFAHCSAIEKSNHYQDTVLCLSNKETLLLQELAQKTATTLNTIIHAAWAYLLYRYSGDSVVVFGETIAGRSTELSRSEEMVGLFINSLPVLVDFEKAQGKGLTAWLQQLNSAGSSRQEYNYLSLPDIQSQSPLNQSIDLFDTLVVLENYPLEAKQSKLTLENIKSNEQSNYGLTLQVIPGDVLKFVFKYKTECYRQSSIELLKEHLKNILNGMLDSKDKLVKDLPLLSQTEKNHLLFGSNCNSQLPKAILSMCPVELVESNVPFYLLNKNDQLVSNNVVGELVFNIDAGKNNTSENDIVGFGEVLDKKIKLHRTGLLLSRDDCDVISYHGKLERQAKISGCRVNCDELSIKLNQCEYIVENYVNKFLHENDEQLVAYIVVEHNESGNVAPEKKIKLENDIRQWMKTNLHQVEVPSCITLLDELPLTNDNEVDKSALPVPVISEEIIYVAPSNELEAKLCNIWSELLGVEKVGINDNFFKLGGNSLTLVRLEFDINEHFNVSISVRELFDNPVVHAQVALIVNRDAISNTLTIKPLSRDVERFPLSFAQERLWFIDQLEGSSHHYNMPAAFRINGVLDKEILKKSLNSIIKRHEILRTVYETDEQGKAYQKIVANKEIELNEYDLTTISTNDIESEILVLAQKDALKKFDLSHDLMLRVSLIHVSKEQQVLLFNMHHIASDGWSVNILAQEFVRFYTAYSNNKELPLEALTIQYADFANWQKDWLKGDNLNSQLNYWINQLKDLPQVHNLPLDKVRPDSQSTKGLAFTTKINKNISDKLTRFSLDNDVTLFMTLQSVFALSIARFSNENDVVMGTPIANRSQQVLAPLIGFFVNSLVLRNKININSSFQELLAETRQMVLDGFEHQNVPFEMLVDALQPEREPSHSPLFQVMFALQNNDDYELKINGMDIDLIEQEHTIAKFDLTLSIVESSEGLTLNWEYCSDIFDVETILTLAEIYEVLLEQISDNATKKLREYTLVSQKEIARSKQWNTTVTTIDSFENANDDFVPIKDSVALVLDGQMNELPMGSIGELYFSGEAVYKAKNDKALVAEQLVISKADKSQYLYRAKQLARRLKSGKILLLGSIDEQVKLKGTQFSLSQVKQAILTQENIKDVLLVINPENNTELFAYIDCMQPVEIEESFIRTLHQSLTNQLPRYMLPDAYKVVNQMPTWFNGEVDVELLPKVIRINRDFVEPETKVQCTLAAIWKELLGLEKVGLHDNFFAVGGTSLSSVRLEFAINEQFNVEISIREIFENAELLQLAELIEAKEQQDKIFKITKVESHVDIPLSFSQQRLWFLDQLEPGSSQYNMPMAIRLKGTLNKVALSSALNHIVARHEVLRTVYAKSSDGQATQVILKNVSLNIDEKDISQLDKVSKEAELQKLIQQDIDKPFNLSNDLMLRAVLITVSKTEYVLLINMHHIASDGWSVAIMIKEFVALYESFYKGEMVQLPTLNIQYADFSNWQRNWLQGEVLESQLSYWKKQLANVPTVHSLPLRQVRPAKQSLAGHMITQKFSQSLSDELNRLSADYDTTLFITLQAAFAILVAKYSNESDIVIGTPIANRPQSELAGLIGFFLNNLVFRNDLSGDPTFISFLKQSKEMALKAYENQHLPFELLVDELNLDRSFSYSPLFQLFFTLQNNEKVELKLPDLELKQLKGENFISKYDLSLSMEETEQGLTATWEYSTELFDELFIKSFMQHFENLLNAICATPNAKLSQLDLFNKVERKRLITQWNDTKQDYDKEVCIHQLFEQQAVSHSNHTALIFENESLTYSELNQKATLLANYLTAKGAGPGKMIALCVERSLDMVVGLLAILKSGSAYVPMDPSYPVDRINYMLDDSNTHLILTQLDVAEMLPAQLVNDCVCIDDKLLWRTIQKSIIEDKNQHNTLLTSDDLAYMIYTSGSTGKPKGVMVSHKNVINFFTGLNHQFSPAEKQDTWLAVTSISFDISILEIFWNLANGNKIVIQPDRPMPVKATQAMDFSLFYFAAEEEITQGNKYTLLLEGAKFIDNTGIKGVWVPERHFASFGDQFPNPSVAAAAVAAVTENITIRAGSVVLPLHDPIRVAEEWSMVDNLSNGRVEISMASGWHPNDFVFFPDDYETRHDKLKNSIDTVHQLWQGNSIERVNGVGKTVEITLHPRPVQSTLTTWFTAAGSPESFKYAGSIGANLLTHLLGQSKQELKEKIVIYRDALEAAGFERNSGKVALMLHTFVGTDLLEIKKVVEKPLKNYLKHSINLLRPLAAEVGLDIENNQDAIIDMGFEKYFASSGLFGTPESCLQQVDDLYAVGVNEIACLIDFGIEHQLTLEHLPYLEQLQKRVKQQAAQQKMLAKRLEKTWSPELLVQRHGVTHIQCTPAFARELLRHESSDNVLPKLDQIMIGGEAFPADLAKSLLAKMPGEIFNMYGPTETTVWSAISQVKGELITLGKPIANTQFYIVSRQNELVPDGVVGELCIAGDGVTKGYYEREALTLERFIDNPFISASNSSNKMYKTGDLVRRLPNGHLEYIGRIDAQVKLRGFRIELGEIESQISTHPYVAEVVVNVFAQSKKLVAYIIADTNIELNDALLSSELRHHLKTVLPEYMIPSDFMFLKTLPLTPNGKVDRKALPEPGMTLTASVDYVAPANEQEEKLCRIWESVLDLKQVGVTDNFFNIGGDSILSIRMISLAKKEGLFFEAKQLFEHQTIRELALQVSHVNKIIAPQTPSQGEQKLLPIQKWLLNGKDQVDMSHYNQSVLLTVPTDFDLNVLKQIISVVYHRHDALRLAFMHNNNFWHAEYVDYSEKEASLNSALITSVDLAELTESEQQSILAKEGEKAQASLSIEQGHLLSAVLLTNREPQTNQLLLVLHHLVVDGISWRILVEDLVSAYQQIKSGSAVIELAPKTSSFQQWGEFLQNYSQSEQLQSEKHYWLEQLSIPVPVLPVDHSNVLDNTQATTQLENFAFTEEQTNALLKTCHQSYRTDITEILLSALLMGVKLWSDKSTLRIDMEAHGRENLSEEIDHSETLGWFTSLYPLTLSLDSQFEKSLNIGHTIMGVKEQVRSIPNKGIGFGVLKYLVEDETLIADLIGKESSIIFNYLGQFEQSEEAGGLFQPVQDFAGHNVSQARQREYLLSISGQVLNGRLAFTIGYNGLQYNRETIAELAEHIHTSTLAIIQHCQENPQGSYTPSDFPLANINQSELEQLQQSYPDLINLYPSTGMQRGLLFHSELRDSAYVTQLDLGINGQLDIALFKQAWQVVIDRHDIFRTAFVGENYHQLVVASATLEWTVKDCRNLPVTQQQQIIENCRTHDKTRGFDFTQIPLMRATLICLSDNENRLIISYHHSLMDAWSQSVVVNDVLQSYQALLIGEAVQLPEAVPYANYIQWLEAVDKKSAVDFWQSHIGMIEEPTSLNIGKNKREESSQALISSFKLAEENTIGLQARAKKANTTLNTLIQAAWAFLLQSYSQQDTVVFGETISGRPSTLAGVEQMVGLFITTLPVKVDISAELKIDDWLKELHQQSVLREEFSYLPLIEIQKLSSVSEQSTLFDTLIAFNNLPATGSDENSATAKAVLSIDDVKGDEQTNYGLTLSISLQETLGFSLSFRSDEYEVEVVERLLGHLENILRSLSDSQVETIKQLSLLNESDKVKVLQQWNDTDKNYSNIACIHQLFEKQVDLQPEATAIVFEKEQLSYRTLNERANRLARYLVEQGVKPDSVVGLCIERCPDMIVAILGIIKAGGAYLPMDPNYPQQRLGYMLENSAAEFVITQTELLPKLSINHQNVLCIDQQDLLKSYSVINLEREVVALNGNHLAYIIYTSGSTGNPKGVMLAHEGLCSLAHTMARDLNVSNRSRMLQFASFSFDATTFEWSTALTAGAALHLVKETTVKSPELLDAYVSEAQITHALLPPVLLPLLEVEKWRSVKSLVIGGDSCARTHADKWSKNRRLFNAYGPSECTVIATMGEYVEGQKYFHIGSPISNTQTYVLDKNRNSLPVGIVGELYIGGIGVAKGYLNNPDLTDDKFVSNIFSDDKNSRLYRTGDLVRWLEDGNLEFVGRVDHQVKIRGFRIELGEIESLIHANQLVDDVIVVATGEPKRLVAYLSLNKNTEENIVDKENIIEKENIDDEQNLISCLRDELSSALPEYMVPAAFILLEKMPQTANGKIDRKALPEPEEKNFLKRLHVAAESLLEHQLSNVWKNVLSLEQVSVTASFFELGGDSLLITRLVNQINEQLSFSLSVRDVFEHNTIRQLASYIEGLEQSEQITIPVISREQSLPLSFSQQRLWFIDQLEPGSSQYNMPMALRLKGELNQSALQQSLDAIIARHEVLRTTYQTGEDGEGCQVIHAAQALTINQLDLSHLADSEREAEVMRLAVEDSQRGFDLSADLMLRVSLLVLSDTESVLLFNLHHIASDGWSMGVLTQEFVGLYQAYSEGREARLPALAIQYADFAHWQREWLSGERLESELSYWEGQLSGIPAVHSLPLDKPRPVVQSVAGASLSQSLSLSLSEELQTLSQSNDATLFMTLQTAFAVLLSRYSHESDIVMGTPIANRTHSSLSPLIGFFVNTLVLRNQIEGELSFSELLQQSKQMSLSAFEHQHLPFEMLVERLQPTRSFSHTPLFQVMFVLQNNESSELSLPKLTLSAVENPHQVAKYDLTLSVKESPDGLLLNWEYCTDLFEADTIKRLTQSFEVLLQGLVAESDKPINQQSLLTEKEKQTLLLEQEQQVSAYPDDVCMHELFEKQVELTPDAVAAVYEEQSLTYRELNKKANRLAHYLVEQGVKPDDLVGLYVERSLEMLVGLLGILKAGGAYVPLDPAYPKGRLSYMLDNAGVSLLLTQSHLTSSLDLTELTAFCLDDELALQDYAVENIPTAESGVSGSHLAYVIYTSGSTGQPKGVMVSRGAFNNFVQGAAELVNINSNTEWLALTTIAFDIAGLELFGPLFHGGKVHLLAYEKAKDWTLLGQYINAHKINVLQATPSTWNALFESGWDGSDELLALVGGEAVEAKMADQILEHCGQGLIHCYGPTEATVWSHMNLINCDDINMSITGLLPGYVHYVVNEKNELQPIGMAGELLLGGASLASGYRHLESLTQERFIKNPFSNKANDYLYRTGDSVRRLADGTLQYLGRLDEQVKIRGFRIELGEIESVISAHEQVKEVVAIVSGEPKQIVAYLIAEDPQIEGSELFESVRQYMKLKLPDYMLPSAMVMLESMPLTLNGKIDRRSLPAPDSANQLTSQYVAPSTEVESKLCDIWSELLNVEKVGVKDNFFDIGGHSLLATRLISLIRTEFELDVAIREIFNLQTIVELAEFIEQEVKLNAGLNLSSEKTENSEEESEKWEI